MRWEEHVDVVRVNGGGEVLVAVRYGSASDLKLPSVDGKKRNIRVGSDGGGLPGNVTGISTRVCSKPMHSTSVCGALAIRGLESEAVDNGWPVGLTRENAACDADIEITGSSTGSQTNKA